MNRIRRFLNNAFNPLCKNPGVINIDAIITLLGIFVFSICAIGEAFGYAKIAEVVIEIGKACFYVGIGRASKNASIPIN